MESCFMWPLFHTGLSKEPIGRRKENIGIRQFYDNINQIQSLRSKRIKLLMVWINFGTLLIVTRSILQCFLFAKNKEDDK